MHAFIPADESRPIQFEEGIPDLDTLQAKAGGASRTVETRSLSREGDEAVLWVAEEGRREGLPVNVRADYLAHMFGLPFEGAIVGDAILTGGADEEGDTKALSESWVLYVGDMPRVSDIATA